LCCRAVRVSFGQPGFKDFVVEEATKKGLDWILLKDGYSATANGPWQTAFTGNQAGRPAAMQIDQSTSNRSLPQMTLKKNPLSWIFFIKTNKSVKPPFSLVQS
jgi:hypothetical protein